MDQGLDLRVSGLGVQVGLVFKAQRLLYHSTPPGRAGCASAREGRFQEGEHLLEVLLGVEGQGPEQG